MKNLYEDILKVSTKYGIPTKDVVNFLRDEPLKNTATTTKTGISRNAINLIKKDLSQYFLPVSSITALNEFGKKTVSDLKNQYKKVDLITLKDRFSPNRDLDQFLSTEETVQKRIELMINNFDIQKKRICFIGEDDFTGIETARLELSEEISIIEIDKRIISKINRFKKEIGLKITSYEHNVQEKLPNTLLAKYDVIFTDPPYTTEGFKLFLSRAIQLLDYRNKSARIYICFGNSDMSKEKYIAIQEIISEAGLSINTILNKFNRYTGADSIGNASNLYICDITPKTKPLITGNYNGKLYTNN